MTIPVLTSRYQVASLLLRGGLAFVFIYAAVSSLLSPNDWVGYLPTFLTHIVRGDTLLVFISVYELVLAIWLVTGWMTVYAALFTVLTLAGITFSNLSLLPISFRDVGLIFAGLALIFIEWPDKATKQV